MLSIMEKRANLNARSFCTNFPLEIAVRKGTCEAHCDCTHATHRHILFEFTNKSAKKLVVELPATVEFGLCSAAFHDVSYDSLFIAWS